MILQHLLLDNWWTNLVHNRFIQYEVKKKNLIFYFDLIYIKNRWKRKKFTQTCEISEFIACQVGLWLIQVTGFFRSSYSKFLKINYRNLQIHIFISFVWIFLWTKKLQSTKLRTNPIGCKRYFTIVYCN